MKQHAVHHVLDRRLGAGRTSVRQIEEALARRGKALVKVLYEEIQNEKEC